MSIAPAGLGIDSHVTTQRWAEGAGGFHPAPLPLGESGVWGKAPRFSRSGSEIDAVCRGRLADKHNAA